MSLDPLRQTIRDMHIRSEASILSGLQADHGPSLEQRKRIAKRGAELVGAIRRDTRPSMMEVFLAEYGLSSDEGIALMCLAEALLRRARCRHDG